MATPANAPLPSGSTSARRRQSRNRADVSLQHLKVSQHVVGEHHRLRPLEVGVAGDQYTVE